MNNIALGFSCLLFSIILSTYFALFLENAHMADKVRFGLLIAGAVLVVIAVCTHPELFASSTGVKK